MTRFWPNKHSGAAYGGGLGVKPPRNQTFSVGTDAGDRFGTALAPGDFNGDGRDDLAIGVPFADGFSSQLDNIGFVRVMYGGVNGITPSGNDVYQAQAGANSQCGEALTSGDFDGDGEDDLAMGCPSHGIPFTQQIDVGLVEVFHGSTSGLISTLVLFPSGTGIERFGHSLTAGDFDNDGFDGLAVGIPGEDVGNTSEAGQVIVYRGSANGLVTNVNLAILNQNIIVSGAADTGDAFGSALTAGDYNGDGALDIAIGAPSEDISTIADAGEVDVFYGGANFTGGQAWHQDTTGILETSETNDNFGGGLDAGSGRDNYSPRNPAYLITADSGSFVTNFNKRRLNR